MGQTRHLHRTRAQYTDGDSYIKCHLGLHSHKVLVHELEFRVMKAADTT